MGLFKKNKNKKGRAGKIRRARIKNVRAKQKKQAKAQKRKSIRRKKVQTGQVNWKKVGVVFLMLCFIVFTIWVLIFSKAMIIDEVEVIGVDNFKEQIISLEREIAQKKIFNQEVGQNLILFSSDKLQQTIVEKFPTIKKVEIKKIFPNKIFINITRRQQIFLWRYKNKCHFLDEGGEVFKEFECENDERKFLQICEDKKKELNLDCQVFVKVGNWDNNEDKIFTKKLIESVGRIMDKIKKTFYFEKDIMVLIPNPTAQEVRIKSENHGELWFSLDDALLKQLEKFRVLLERKIDLSDLENMQYIDLRLGNKIIYKLKEGADDYESTNPLQTYE